MFESKRDIPRAIATNHPEDYTAATIWCRDHLEDGQKVLAWFAQKNMVDNDPDVEAFCSQALVVVGTTRGRTVPAGFTSGPAIIWWADENDIAAVERIRGVTAIVVVPSTVADTAAWAEGNGAERLGRAAEEKSAGAPALDPVVERALSGMNPNLNNVLTSGYEKDIVVSHLLGLHDGGYELDVRAIKTWAVAAGWPVKRVTELGELVSAVASGKRPRVRPNMLRSGWLSRLEAH